MLFQNTRQHISHKNPNGSAINGMLEPMKLTRFRPHVQSNQASIPIQIPETQPKTMLWGEPTWFLFHTFAQKVKESTFPKIKNELLSMIYKICNNLPCPDCTNHAMRYLQGINFGAIHTKNDLIEMLWRFHNEVNHRKHYQQFPMSQLNAKYSNANTNNIIRNFIQYYDKRGFSMRAGTDSFHRTRMITSFKTWISANIQYFDP